ncbi:MAG: hypothetical protein AAGF47_07930, partial [Planctomycetota bacterium]
MMVLHAAWDRAGLKLWAEHAVGAAERRESVFCSAESIVAMLDRVGIAAEPSLLRLKLPAAAPAENSGDADHDESSGDEPPQADLLDPGVDSDVDPDAHGSDEQSSDPAEHMDVEPGPEPAAAQDDTAADGMSAVQVLPSPRAAHAAGRVLQTPERVVLAEQEVGAAFLANAAAAEALDRLSEAAGPGAEAGVSLAYMGQLVRFAYKVVAQQRFVPGLWQDSDGSLTAGWQPWLADEHTSEEAAALIAAMPPVVRAVSDAFDHDPAAIVGDLLSRMTDTLARRALIDDELSEVLEDRDESDLNVGWLIGLLGESRDVTASDRRSLI